MREFELVIDDAIKAGLNPETKSPINTPFLYDCLGFRCGKSGIERYETLNNPLPSTLDIHYSWPFPQVVTGERYNILVVRDSSVNHQDDIYSISDDGLTVNHLFTIDQLTFGTGSLLELADFGKGAIMVNGVVMLYWDDSISGWQKITSSSTIPMMKTVCNFKGQAVGGNISGSWYDCDETFYIWSDIGSLDFTPDRRNEAGYRRCPFGGEVYHVRRLGDIVIGYSSKGIVALVPVKDPAPTFGFKELSNIGLVNRGAVNGNLDRQIYVGSDYIIREITSGGITELGYQSYMESLGSSEDIIVLYDPANRDFYIGNSSTTYLLSPYGMTKIQQHPSAVWRGDTTYAIPDSEDSDSPYIQTEQFDMTYKGQKTIFSIETDALSVNNPEVMISWTNDLLNWSDSTYFPINDVGIASPIVSGNVFKIKMKFDSINSAFRLGYLIARFKMTDLRGLRGVYAPPIRGQR